LQNFKHAFRAMASGAEVQVYADDEPVALDAFERIVREVERIEAKYSRFRADSTLTRINQSAGGEPVRIDAETSGLLDYADACWRQSGGLFDITSGILRQVWDWKRGVPPRPRDFVQVLPRIGWDRVRREGDTVALEAGMELDMGGMGKEYAADRAVSMAKAAGIEHGFVNFGGDIRVIGPRPDGRPWRAGIVHPRATERTIAHVELTDGGLATSGDYERYFEYEGRRYCHILNPRTGWPVEGPQSVSVLAPLCIVAGSCATIAMLHGDQAEAYLIEQRLPYLIVDRNGDVHRSAVA
jgi:thiamine biosynthesis lipoprotein